MRPIIAAFSFPIIILVGMIASPADTPTSPDVSISDYANELNLLAH